jgi:hypothetical protein
VLLLDLQHGPAQLSHGLDGKERQHLITQQLPLIYRYVSLSLFLFSHWEGGGEMMEDRARGCRLCMGATASFIAPQCNN